MSWLKNTSLSFARQLSRTLDPQHDYEPQACYNSFCKHWQQAYEIIVRSQPQHLHDDVLGVVNHLEQLTTLLVLEARAKEIHVNDCPSSCLEYLLSENLLDKLYEWATCTGKYENVVRLEQLKLYSSLITHHSSQVIAAEPFLRPLLKLLSGFRNELPPTNVETQLVTVLNQLCVVLMQNMKLIDLFFLTTHTHKGSIAEFIIVRLLLTSVHREGSTGAAARDALLLCAKMSARSTQLAACVLAGNTCPVLATGLSGLYSHLPRTLSEKIHSLTPDDVIHVHKLSLFIDSLEFCNAVAEVAHPSIKKQLLDLLYQGFLVPVVGPALLQNGVSEQTAAVAYLELLLRSVTPRGLLRPVLHYLFTYQYDGVKLIDALLKRLDGNSQQSLVSLSLMETLIDLNCEDVMLELVFKYLLNGNHLMAIHKHQISQPEHYREAAVAFLSLSPRCCSRPLEATRAWVDELALSGRRILDIKTDEDNRRVNGFHDGIAMNSLTREIKINYGNRNESLFGNYHAYLCDARFEIVSRKIASSNWTSRYDSVSKGKSEANNNTKETKDPDGLINSKEPDSLTSVCTNGYDTLKTSDTSEKESHSLLSLIETDSKLFNSESKGPDSLTSVGESSGYDSFRCKMEENDEDSFAEESFRKIFDQVDNGEKEFNGDLPSVRSWRTSAESIIGPLLFNLLKKAAMLLEADMTVNFRVSSILSKLASMPTPLLMSLLLCPRFVLKPNVPSLFQILAKLKDEVDELTFGLDNTSELVDKARVFLIQREMTLVKSRLAANEDGHSRKHDSLNEANEPLRRGENKRRSFSTSLSNMFARRLSNSNSSQNSHHTHTTFNSSPQKRLIFTQESYWDQSITLRSILNAVILDEWLKELAALCEEHALRLSAVKYEDNSYIRSVAL